MTRSLCIVAILVGIAAVGTRAHASNADSCYVTTSGGTTYAAECIGNYTQHTSEDYSGLPNPTGCSSDTPACACYGACGPGCNFTCSSGGACLTHDYNTRKYGILSSQALSVFPPALIQWGGCEVGRAVQSVGTNVFSRFTGYVEWGAKKLAGLF
jgi:hypothetical protein